ncbi:MAG: TonB-dependent receptor [Flavobacteriaceae bacterium]
MNRGVLIRLIWIILAPISLCGQINLEGQILEGDTNLQEPLIGANIYHLASMTGTVTDDQGEFSLTLPSLPAELIVSYVGYITDTISVDEIRFIRHIMEPEGRLDEVVVNTRRSSQFVSSLSTQQVIRVSSDELLKAACCNLSESFETNPAIDVNFSDAVTGTKQIKMLGLTSPYILITAENIPVIRGAAQSLGLSYVPGTWVESMQITKGAGSVTNGYESIAGQINVELQKPNSDVPFYLNAFTSGNGRQELNAHLNVAANDRWNTGFYVHGNHRPRKVDRNGDGFLDTPMARQVNVLNRWQYTDAQRGWVSFINARVLSDEKIAGQLDYTPNLTPESQNVWGSKIQTDRLDLSAKLGYVNPDIPYQTAGVQGAYSWHNQDSHFGKRPYNIEHHSAYLTFLYNSIISDTRHKIKLGLNGTFDRYFEDLSLDAAGLDRSRYNRTERGVGLFAEYAYDDLDKLGLTLGLRVDQHNLLGLFVTPRLHVKYQLWPKTTLRGSVGRGKRIPNIFAEQLGVFSSGRTIVIDQSVDSQGEISEALNGNFYGLNPEIAWNFGLSLQHKLNIGTRELVLGFDYYRTDFVDQVVVDWEQVGLVRYYNRRGSSWTQSYQLDASYSPWGLVDMRFAYKYYDLSTAFKSGNKQPILTPSHRVFGNLAYEFEGHRPQHPWKMDLTINWLGEQRLPELASEAALFGRDTTPSITTMNAQITKEWGKAFDWYFGIENLSDVRQDRPIINGDRPFDTDFDGSMVYGPIFGRMWYTGIRYRLE